MIWKLLHAIGLTNLSTDEVALIYKNASLKKQNDDSWFIAFLDSYIGPFGYSLHQKLVKFYRRNYLNFIYKGPRTEELEDNLKWIEAHYLQLQKLDDAMMENKLYNYGPDSGSALNEGLSALMDIKPKEQKATISSDINPLESAIYNLSEALKKLQSMRSTAVKITTKGINKPISHPEM